MSMPDVISKVLFVASYINESLLGRLSGVTCSGPSVTFCRAVESFGRVAFTIFHVLYLLQNTGGYIRSCLEEW